MVWGFQGSGNLYNFYVAANPAQSDIGSSMTLTVTIPKGAATGVDGIPLATPASLTIDTGTITGPTVILTSGQTHDYWSNTAIPVTATFSEPVTGFTAGSLNNYSPNATVSNFQQNPQDLEQYTFDLTPVGSPNSVQVGINAGGITGVTSGKPLTGLSFTLIRNLVAGPVVTNVTSNASGTELPGSLIPVQVTFSSPVIVNTAVGLPVLLLNADGPGGNAMATYVGGGSPNAPSTTLVFNYVVQAGQRTADLDEFSSSAFISLGQSNLIAGNILDATTKNAIPTPVLFDPGSPRSLGGNTQIAVGTAATGVIDVSSTKPDGIYGVGTLIPITVQFNAPVTVKTTGGTPTLALAVAGGTGTANATYVSGSGTDTLTFDFTPIAGQTSPALDYTSTGALSLNGGQILIGNTAAPADLTLPPPGTLGSLGTSGAVAVVDHPAQVLAVWDNQTNATVGPAGVIQIFVTFDSPVTVHTTGGTPTLTLALDNGQTVAVNYTAGSGTTSLEFDYTVGTSDTSRDLDYASAGALALEARRSSTRWEITPT